MTEDAAGGVLELRSWPGHMEADYIYTAGVAGDRFFRELRGSGRLLAAKCPKCGRKFLPPRLFCELCFVETKDWVEVPNEGSLDAATVVRVDPHGVPLSQPEVWGLVRFAGIYGGLIHRIGVEPQRARPGLRVRAVLKPAQGRRGAIDDIEWFIPVGPNSDPATPRKDSPSRTASARSSRASTKV